MNEHDTQLDAALTDTFARRDREVGHVAGDVADVYRRVARRKTKRRTLTAVASVALVAAGIGGLVAVGQIGSDAPARGAGAPVPTMPGEGGSWYVCSGAMPQDDGRTLYDSCELESPYGNPAWSCVGQIADPATDGDDRPRFESCTAVGEAYPYPPTGSEVCVDVTVVPVTSVPGSVPPAGGSWEVSCVPLDCAPVPTTLPPDVVPGPTIAVAPCTWPANVSPYATLPPECAPPTAPATTTGPTLPPVPTTTRVEYGCTWPTAPAPSVPGTLPPIPPPASSVPVSIGGWGENTDLTGTFVVADESVEAIAELFGVTVDDLVTANGWEQGIVIGEGARVAIPGRALCILSLAPGDSPLGVAGRYGLDESQLARLNPDVTFDGSTDDSGYPYWIPGNTILVPNKGAC